MEEEEAAIPMIGDDNEEGDHPSSSFPFSERKSPLFLISCFLIIGLLGLVIGVPFLIYGNQPTYCGILIALAGLSLLAGLVLWIQHSRAIRLEQKQRLAMERTLATPSV